jgi:hypothetical protein
MSPAALQAVAMFADEGICHRRRGLGRWERLGHPLDTLSVAACYAWLLCSRPGQPSALVVYVALAALSCLLITKDEKVHASVCDARESWLHSVLFVLHPIVFLSFGLIWLSGQDRWLISVQLSLTIGFAAYQILYWSVPWKQKAQM